MRVGIGYSDIPDSEAAGKQAAESAVAMACRREPCDIVLLFCTARHDQRRLREAVASVVGDSVPVYGGGAAGVITNHAYGYAGDQVGIACFWLDGARCEVITDGGLAAGEEDTGFRMGRKLAPLGAAPSTSVMLLYDAVSRDDAGLRMMMATPLLAGLEKSLGFLPSVYGAGLMGDHACSLTGQYTGGGMGEQYAMALVFSEDIRIDTVTMHGCRPASPYYTVTRADGPVILEINRKPALVFMGEVLGDAVSPEQYPFFLLFGVNHGERWAEYDEDSYATRLCCGIDRERGGIVMFEPDMAEGVEFQVMFRSFDLEYMKPKIESLFERLDGREPVFAMYIDCAGRCAGYGGTDMEDALVVRQTIAERVPVLGIYTGVEIAPLAGRSRGLDWTGVFCLFSRRGGETLPAPERMTPAKKAGRPKRHARTPQDAALKLCEQNMAKILDLDSQCIALRHELELKRRGFQLLSELAVSLRKIENHKDMFIRVAQRINATLNMHKTLVLFADEKERFMPGVLQGFSPEEQERLAAGPVAVPQELLLHSVVITGEDSAKRFAALRAACNLPFFTSSPVFLQGKAIALLLVGRMVEQPPYFPRLRHSDLETVRALTDLLESVLVRLRLRDVTHEAATDGLTGLWSRNTFQNMVEGCLDGEENAGAFMMVDVDYFKSVNDDYGHLEGDAVLGACAAAMRRVLRDSDIIGRLGGDEFAVFCRGIRNRGDAEKKAVQIRAAWQGIFPGGRERHITASIGIALAPRHGTSFQELYANADTALYQAKSRGRDCCVICA